MAAVSVRQPALNFIFVTLVLIVLGFGIVIPVLPGLVTEFEGGRTADGAHTYGWLIGIFALAQFVAAPVLGALSDRFGRRKVILVALAGTAVDYVVVAWAPSLTWLFVARTISGLTAGAISACNAYIADVTPPERRAQGFGMGAAAFGLGFAIGPAIGGFLGDINLRLPFLAAAGCVTINWIYGALVLPESLPPEKRRAFDWRRANPFGALANLRRIHGLSRFAAMHFIQMLAQTMVHSTWVLYTGHRFGWSPRQTGVSLMVAGTSVMIVQGRLVGPIIRRTGEARGLLLGLSVTVIVLILYGRATQGWMMYGAICLGAFGGIAGPAAQALITRRVPANEQGAVQGALGGLQSLGAVIAPPLAAWSFAAGIAPGRRWQVPGIAFFEAAAFCLLALAIAWRAVRMPPLPAVPGPGGEGHG